MLLAIRNASPLIDIPLHYSPTGPPPPTADIPVVLPFDSHNPPRISSPLAPPPAGSQLTRCIPRAGRTEGRPRRVRDYQQQRSQKDLQSETGINGIDCRYGDPKACSVTAVQYRKNFTAGLQQAGREKMKDEVLSISNVSSCGAPPARKPPQRPRCRFSPMLWRRRPRSDRGSSRGDLDTPQRN